MMRFLLVLGLSLSISLISSAQSAYTKYQVSFTDKKDSPYTIQNPESFLSAKAIARRQKQGILIEENDLPVNEKYVKKINSLGAKVLYTSKWFNTAIVQIMEEGEGRLSANILDKIKAFDFVQNVEVLLKYEGKKQRQTSLFGSSSLQDDPKPRQSAVHTTSDIIDRLAPKPNNVYYGTAFKQLQMLNGDYLHAQGFTGKGMSVAVMDAGFINVDRLSVFRHLFDSDKIRGTKDFVDGDEYVFAHGTHGTQVLSTMAARLPGAYVGAAPDAEYWLLRTEDSRSETSLEEYNWIAAAEFADSVGVDIINTSLGYSSFDDPKKSYNYKDMDGNTTYISRGADIAASKGILVVSSAGNKGSKAWKYVTAPADADSVLSVGAVDKWGSYTAFSSTGPTFDGRTKPNIVAQGKNTALVQTNGKLKYANGTSFAAPIIAGLATCLWQANLDKTNIEILRIIEKSANQYQTPDYMLGHGLPDFYRALLEVTDDENLKLSKGAVAFVYPNSQVSQANVYYYAQNNEDIVLELCSVSGSTLERHVLNVHKDTPYKFSLDWLDYPEGVFLVKLINGKQQKVMKAVKMGG